ncbi:MAG: MFS transporter [Bacillota bacterium]
MPWGISRSYLGDGKSLRELARCSVHHFLNDGYSWSLYPLLPFIAADFGLSYAGTGAIKTAMNLLLSGLGIPFSMLAERIGDLTALTLGTVIFSLGIAALGLTWSYYAFLAGVFIAGAGGAAAHPVGSALVSRGAPADRMGAVIGVFNFSGDVGKALCPVVAGFIAAAFGWRASLMSIGVVGALLALGLHRLEKQASEPEVEERERPVQSSPAEVEVAGWGITSWRAFLALHFVGVLDSLARSGVVVFASFALVDKGFSAASLGGFLGLLAAGGAAGKLVCGPMSDFLGKRNMVIVTEVLTTLGILAFLHSGGSWVGAALIFLGVFLNGTSSVLYALVPTVTTERRRSRGFAIYYTVTLAASGLAPLLYGLIGDWMGLYSMFHVMAWGLLLTVPLSFLLNPTH